jgi:hypothetical protein
MFTAWSRAQQTLLRSFNHKIFLTKSAKVCHESIQKRQIREGTVKSSEKNI